jgi:pimeloyl-ACP methyl ester carboxylesterase
MTSHLETVDLRIKFNEFGKHGGDPVLFLHGWPDDASTWNAVISKLADEKLRLVIPTLRALGGTVFLNDRVPRTANGGILAMDAIALIARTAWGSTGLPSSGTIGDPTSPRLSPSAGRTESQGSQCSLVRPD